MSKLLICRSFYRNFGRDLRQFSSKLVPDMLALLRNNAVANPEKLLLELIEEQQARLDDLTKRGVEATDTEPKDGASPT